MYRLAHLSDPHVPPETRPRRRELLSKRMIGWTNWRRSRRRIHRREVLDLVTADLADQNPDHVAVTGDLTIVSSRGEWEACREWLASLGDGGHVSLVPGNHDAYTRRAVPGTARAWKDYMRGDDAPVDLTAAEFPYFRRRGPAAIIGCSSAVVNAPFLATGRVGSSQRELIGTLLRRLRKDGLFRVVLIHHPPLRAPGDRYRRLTDARDFSAMLADAGAELVLHGHEHTALARWLPGREAPIPVIGVPSASALAHGSKPAAEYNIYSIDGAPGAWSCVMHRRGFSGTHIEDIARSVLWDHGMPADEPTAPA